MVKEEVAESRQPTNSIIAQMFQMLQEMNPNRDRWELDKDRSSRLLKGALGDVRSGSLRFEMVCCSESGPGPVEGAQHHC